MKCDELQRYSVDIDYIPNDDGSFMDADQVDAAIAELQAENNRLKKKMDDYHLMSDIRRAKIKELKRSLWMARALRARDIQRWWIAATCAKQTERECSVWNNVERKCRAKADEYK